MMTKRSPTIAASVLTVLLAAGGAHAQVTPGGPAVTAPKSAPSATDIAEARRHYERGLQLYTNSDYDGALAEIDRAYQLAPSYKILFNLGRIHRQLNNYTAALVAFQRYLDEGGAEVPEDRRIEVENEVKQLSARVATLEVKALPGATISVDDVPVGKTPLAKGVLVNPGRRRVSAALDGYAPATSVVTVVGSDTKTVELKLVSLTVKTVGAAPDTAPKTRAIVAWSVTGALGVAAVALGVSTIVTHGKYDPASTIGNPDAKSDLDGRKSTIEHLALATDILIGATVVGAGISTYFTYRWLKHPGREQTRPEGVDVAIRPGGVALLGRF